MRGQCGRVRVNIFYLRGEWEGKKILKQGEKFQQRLTSTCFDFCGCVLGVQEYHFAPRVERVGSGHFPDLHHITPHHSTDAKENINKIGTSRAAAAAHKTIVDIYACAHRIEESEFFHTPLPDLAAFLPLSIASPLSRPC